MRVLNHCLVDVFATFRQETGMSLREAERIMGLSHGYISRIESKRIEPSSAFCLGVIEIVSNHFEKKPQQNQGFAVGVSNHPLAENNL